MTDLIPYTPHTIEVTLDGGIICTIPLHPSARLDRATIGTWLASKSEKTVLAYSKDINHFYQEIGKPMAEVRLEDLYAFRDSMAHLEPASRNRALAAIKSLFSFAARTRLIEYNVTIAFTLPKLENKLAERIMSEQSMEDILRLETDQRNHAILSLLYYGALRVSEVCNLQWRNLQERNQSGQIAVFGKGKKTRHVLLDTDTWREVWALRGNAPIDEYVFLSRQAHSRKDKQDKRISEARVFQIVREAANRAGVAPGKVSPHWFRHAHATHSLEAGASLAEVQQVLGHERPETTLQYNHVRPNVSTATLLRKKKTNQ